MTEQEVPGPNPRVSRRTVLGATLVGGVGLAAGVAIGRNTTGASPTESTGRQAGFDRTAVVPIPRSRHATAVLENGLVLCIGGVSASGQLASCQVYDPDSDLWFDASPLAKPRSWHSATPLANGKVLTLGGFDGSGALGLASVFDPVNDTWTRARPLQTPRFNHAATLLPDGRIVLTGGTNRGPLVAAEIYEPEAD